MIERDVCGVVVGRNGVAPSSVLLLGAFQVRHRGAVSDRFRGTKVRALLAYLAVEADRPHTRSALAGLFWPDQPQEQALRNLSQALVRVRQALTGAEDPLHVTRQAVQWRPDGAQVDVTEFSRLARSPDPAELERAAALYRGEFLAGFALPDCEAFEEWLLLTRERLQHQALGVWHQLGEAALAAGQTAEAVAAARRQLALDPWREPAHRQLMRSLALSGDRAAALAAYARCCQLLREELDVPPDEETRALAARIEAGELPPEAALSAPSTPPARTHNLPAPLASFVGREDELACLAAEMQGTARLVTVVGAGGSGKTRLALAAAWALRPQFTNGVWWVSLAGVQPGADPEFQRTTIVSTVAAALEITLDGRRPALKELAAVLRDRTALLVLDNCEQLPEAAMVARPLLEAAPNLRILATSREPLGLEGETLLRLGGLPLPEPGAPNPEGYAGVGLFVERARRQTPGWGQHTEEVEAAARLCRLLEGLPLGIELAAHWVGHYTPDEIGAAIQTDLAFLTARTRNVPDRQRSLRAVFDYTWDLLTEEERQALARLSIFRGSFDRTAAQAVADVAPTTLVTLVDKSLLRQAGAGRCSLHELLRQFAAERLAIEGEAQMLGDQHLAHYVRLAEQAAAELTGPHQPSWMERLDRDLDNLRAALSWAREQGLTEVELRLAVALYQVWFVRGQLNEARRWLEDGLERGRGVTQGLRASALWSLGGIAIEQGDHERATRLLEDALSLFQGLGDRAGTARTLNMLGLNAARRGEYARATALFEEGLRLATELEDPRERAFALVNLGLVATHQGDFATARERYEEALILDRARGDRHAILVTLGNIAYNVALGGHLDEAETLFVEVLALARELGVKSAIAHALENLGDLATQQGMYEGAAVRLRESLLLGTELGDRYLILAILGDLAKLEAARGEAGQAARLGGAEARLREELHIPLPLPELDSRKGALRCARERLGEQGFRHAWEEGQAMDLEEAMAYALGERTVMPLNRDDVSSRHLRAPGQHPRSGSEHV